MPSYHVLDASGGEAGQNADYRTAMHVAVPAENNQVGTALKDCIAADTSAPWLSTSAIANLNAPEVTALTNRTLVEVIFHLVVNPAKPNAEKIALLDQNYALEVARVQAEIRRRYQYWGYSRTP